jgi:hypothetical protein
MHGAGMHGKVMVMPMPLERWLSGLRDLLGRLWFPEPAGDLRCPRCQSEMYAVFDPFAVADWDAPWSLRYVCPRCDGGDPDR